MTIRFAIISDRVAVISAEFMEIIPYSLRTVQQIAWANPGDTGGSGTAGQIWYTMPNEKDIL